MVEEVLPEAPYVSFEFTIPKMLRKLFLFDRGLYGDLARAAYAATRKFLAEQFPAVEHLVPAMVAAPRSWGGLDNFRPHLHALASIGVFDRDGVLHLAPFDLDFSALEELFREQLLRLLHRRGKIDGARVRLLRSWTHSGFALHAERRIPAGARDELERQLAYMERPPLSLKRLSLLPDGCVHYQSACFHPGVGRDHQLLPGIEFLALIVPHVKLRYESTIRTYAAISTSSDRRLGWILPSRGRGPRPRAAPRLSLDTREVEY